MVLLHPASLHFPNLAIELYLIFADQDSVRLLAVESCGAFAQALSREDAVVQLLPVVQKFAAVGLTGKQISDELCIVLIVRTKH